ncbi:unnamed protein product [Adineta steineri]|uniref:Uncharacterized protein n=1 Tax=Adineta steineri TaxID=433720 RepID=A0A818QZM5_9BILA|nr:unnamed protein product [Adineta steineri]CAF3649443.1 unnamed protein product [Adineta steineri]CAF4110241.1 unnamed protein product [Adineta steineri]
MAQEKQTGDLHAQPVSSSQSGQTRVEMINEWREQRQGIINEIVREATRQASNKERAKADDILHRQLSADELHNTKEDLFDHLDQLLEQSLNREWNSSDTTELNDDDSISEYSPSEIPTGFSRQYSSQRSVGSSVDQVSVLSTENKRIPCTPDGNNGAVALHEDELVFVNIRKGSEICVIPNLKTKNVLRRLPFIDLSKRIVDIDYSTYHKQFVMATNKFASASRDGNDDEPYLYLFDTHNDSFERWMAFSAWESIQRVCCTPLHAYLIIQSVGESIIAQIPMHTKEIDRRFASDLISLPHERRFRLIDINCSASIRHQIIAIAYNGADRSEGGEGPIGICLFNTNWIRLASIADIGNSSMPYCVPRLTWLNKLNILAMINFESGDLIMFNSSGEKQDVQPYSRIVEDEKSGQTNSKPINICATQNWAAIRYAHFINIHRIND